MKQIMDMEVMQSGNKELPKTGSYGIDFAHVTFRYTKEGEEVLSDIDLHLKAGSINAFVGPSGAGKTTAAQLIGRYWDADSGTVKIGGVPVNELKAENLSELLCSRMYFSWRTPFWKISGWEQKLRKNR